MSKEVNIEFTTIKVPIKINVDGKDYPLHSRNIDVVRQYEATKDESVLDKLVDFSISFA